MKPARIIVICVAAISAIGLALVVRTMGSSSGQPTTPAAAESPATPTEPMAKVLVAAKDLPAGSRLTAADMVWKDWAVSAVDAAWVTDGTVPIPARGQTTAAAQKPDGAVARVTRAATEAVTQASKSDFVGAVVRETILAGEPIVARKVVPAGDSGYMAAYLEPGMRAMAIRVTVETAAGGFILPGDRVDVLLTRETTLSNMGTQEGDRPRFSSSTVLQNVKVLAIDQSTRVSDSEQAVVGATATLEVRPGDAEALALAKSEGELSLVLRSYADTGGPSGRVGAPRNSQGGTVRVYRGGETEVVVVP
ncbi:MAG: Flp pilus assembly protein CpaB [Brevundimonas sp.]|uniref:Flp pilus assembly protein CpaB n=1 Tax=Brevundimonas sp. TaxID=1871086 RepID=UPI002732D6C8|nr:Flp pilus assembly protein CpaB [Brevundimonas sp.]MDP3377408.1 Flp pilus assembly protein CpaB [Brevundimonas sp.]